MLYILLLIIIHNKEIFTCLNYGSHISKNIRDTADSGQIFKAIAKMKKTLAEPVTSSTKILCKKYIFLQLRVFTLYSYFTYT